MPYDSERLFVDLIFRSSNKYASWDPEVVVKAGDYGRITTGKTGWAFWRKSRGTFLRKGTSIRKPEEHGVSSSEGVTWITSKNASQVDFDMDISGQTPIFAECNVKAAFKFNSGRGAILAMDNDTISTINPPGKLRRLLDEKRIPKGSVIVSEVHQCSSYARYLSTEGSTTILMGLSVEAPAGNIASANLDAKWMHSASAGNFKMKVNKDGKRDFYPLFRLVSLVENGVSKGLRGELDEDPPLPDAEPPWAPMEGEAFDLEASEGPSNR
ncbi:hypothetical protein BDZ97DRAFT_1762985 [Flammula alnicola]|nr:hypothetical protein BDZ97DRAFT_1762985 [Flammula alnicola]